MKFECDDCGSIFYEKEVKSWADIVAHKEKSEHSPLCPFCGSKWIKE